MHRSIISAFLLLFSLAALPVGTKSQGLIPVLPSVAPPVLVAPPDQALPKDGTVIPVNGSVTVKIINKSNAKVKYQFLGETRPIILEGKSESKSANLPVPVSLTFRREDNGFLKAVLKSSADGVLEVELAQTADFNVDHISLWISPKGNIYLN